MGGGVKVCAQADNLSLTPLYDAEVNNGVVQFKNTNLSSSCLGGASWATTFNTGEIHIFTVTIAESSSINTTTTLCLTASTTEVSKYGSPTIVGETSTTAVSSKEDGTKQLVLRVESNYGAVYLWQSAGESNGWGKVKIASITREVVTASSVGKTNVSYNIPGKNVLFSDSFNENLNKWSSLNTDNGTVDWNNSEGHSATGCMKVVNNSNRNKEQWKIQRGASFSSTISQGTTFYISFYIKCESGTGSIRCSTTGHAQYQDDQAVSTEWQPIVWPVTAEGDIDGFCLDMAHTANTYYIDDVEVYTNADTGGSNVFTSVDQVANISSSAFSSLAEGDYICADVTGTPETIKLVCNGKDYALTQFNGGTLWGIKATDEMVTALKANDSQFKGHDLILNGIDIYKTVALGEGDNSTALASKINNVFVELTRSFVADNWNTVCLPFALTSAQATQLFGSDYKLAAFTGVSGTTMKFTTIDDIAEFEAGKPYLVMPKEGCATGTTVLFNVNITAKDPTPVPQGNYTFTGTFTTKTFTSSDYATSRFVATGNELVTPNENSILKSLRCYFTVPATPVTPARSLTFDVDEEGGTTSINTVQGSGFRVNGYYNLNGQRVAQPTKGLYIVNGKKVVIK